ncbi:MAG: class I SAM-dependent methyltransferase [Rhodothermia bacterium]|nr:class I SAM-dependent methyltransferase [Rhodothermia bacterium]
MSGRQKTTSSDSSTSKWYEEWFDRDEYEIVYQHRDEDEARRVIDLIEKATHVSPGDRVVDVGCGRGRHAVELAGRGYRVTGLDLSERSIEAAKARASEQQVTVDFRVGDMREPVCEGCFDGAVNLFTAFGYFESEAEHQRAVSAIADSLVDGGWFFQDFLNPDYVRANLVPSDTERREGVEIEQYRALEDGRIRKEIILRRNGREHRFSESVQLLELEDFRRLYKRARLEIRSVFGDYDGGELTGTSPRMILLSRKTAPRP